MLACVLKLTYLVNIIFFYLFKCSQNIAKKSLNDADSLIF